MGKYQYIIHTDGAYSRVHDEGAFAYVICDGDDNELNRNAWKIQHETNNRAELKAIIAALYYLPEDAKKVRVESDSKYALNTLFGGWAKTKNVDLFEVFGRIMKERRLSVEPVWVKGHSGDKFNDICDEMCNNILGYDANAEIEKYRKK